jgi:hypothetical protein
VNTLLEKGEEILFPHRDHLQALGRVGKEFEIDVRRL